MQHDHLVKFSELSDSFEPNAARTAEKRDFAAQVNAAMAVQETVGENTGYRYRSKEEKLEALDNIVSKGTNDLDSSQIMALFSAYRDLAAFDKMISLYKGVENEDFKNAPMVREQLAVAYRKVPRGNKSDEEQKLADKMWDYHVSMDICLGLIDEGYGNGVAYENIGRCLRYIANKTEMKDKNAEDKRKKELLVDSVIQLENGFMSTLESSVGIQAVHGNIMLGHTEKAKETAKVVYLAALRDGAEETNDYFCVSAALQAACIAGEDEKVVNHLYNRLENSIRYQWELDDISRDMGRIAKAFPSERMTEICRRLEGLKESAVPQEDKSGVKTDVIVFNHQRNTDRYISEDPKLQAVRNYSYSYRGCGSAFRGANRVGGNMAFGGQLPDHTVSRKDLRLFTGLIKMTPVELGIEFDKPLPGADMARLMNEPLTEVKDPDLFMRLVDRFVRQTFTTEHFAGTKLHMENNALDKNKYGESVYDATVKSVLRACGKKIGDKDRNVDTRTNISAIFALGMGDCRHHAQAKQIMFDMWQKQQMNDCLSDMYYSVWQGKPVETAGPRAQKFFDILDTELRTADIEVRMPVLMQQEEKKKWLNDEDYIVEKDENGKAIMVDKLYSPRMTDDGKYMVDPENKTHNLEDHTLCWLIKKDREGRLTGFGLRDAFYQDLHYGWGQHDVDVDKIRVENGKPQIPAGEISGDRTSTGQSVQICQSPTPYNSGKRDMIVSNSIGRDVCLVGVPLDGFATPADFVKMIKDRDGMADILQSILLKDKETKGQEAWRGVKAEQTEPVKQAVAEVETKATVVETPKKNSLQTGIAQYVTNEKTSEKGSLQSNLTKTGRKVEKSVTLRQMQNKGR